MECDNIHLFLCDDYHFQLHMEVNMNLSNEKFHLKVCSSLLFLALRFSRHITLTMACVIHQEPLLNLAETKRMQVKIKSWYVCLCIADALHEELDLSQGVPTFGKFAESWRFHQSPWGITLREHSAKIAEVNVQTLWKTTGCFVSRGVTWMHY